MDDIDLIELEKQSQGVVLKKQQEDYISFLAMGGLITDDDGKVTKMTQQEFADAIHVHPNTLTNWKKSIPNLGERIRKRREEIFPVARETAIWNRMYVVMMTTKDAKAVNELGKTLLGHNGELRLPVQRQDVKVQGSLAELLSNSTKIIEGQTVDES